MACPWAQPQTAAATGGRRFTLDLPAFVASPGKYARGSFDLVGGWFMLFIGLATTLAALGAGLLNGARISGKLHAAAVACRLLPAGAARTRSGWTHVVREFEPDAYKQVTCLLDDGTRVVGWLTPYGTVPEDVPDRDVVLAAPLIFYRPDGGADVASHGAVSLSARRSSTCTSTTGQSHPTRAKTSTAIPRVRLLTPLHLRPE
ncbi:DUF6338 family protein [Nocardioides sp. NPDC058538]|uniref:DUF6338 family protein n=1 Tax=Nocardioides sp. NPDC058538 TaxID=3346542 RepID=UPI00365A97A1